jgi:hypothetical protein
MNLSNLSKEEQIKLYDTIQEIKRRGREKGVTYSPNEGQLEIHRSSKITRAVFCGNSFGKTTLGCNEAKFWAEGFNPITKEFSKVPSRTIIVLDHPEKVADKWLPELRKWTIIKDEDCHKRGKPYVNRITWPTGSEFLFMFHDQTDLQFESIEADYLIFDEPPPRRVYIALIRGLRNKNRHPRLLILGTPLTGAWMRKEIQVPWSKGELPDTDCFTFSSEVNAKNLPEGYIERFSQVLSEKERQVRLHGRFFDLDGAALSHLFDRSIHVIDPFDWPEEYPVVVSIDPHPTKPHHACMIGVDKEGYLYYLKEMKAKAVAKVFANYLKDFYQGYRVVDIVHDCLGESEGTGGEGFKSFSQVLRECGVLTRATTWNDKSDDDFIERIRNALAIPEEADNFGKKTPKLRIFRGNFGIVNDIENVQWTKMRNYDEYKPKLDIADTDNLSCLKYALATNLTPLKGKAKIYHRTSGFETYGIKKASPAKQIFRAVKANYSGPKNKTERWEDW